MGFFDIFSKTALTILFNFLQIEDIVALHMCAKFQVQENFCSPDMGSKEVKKGGFRGFLIK